MNTSRTPNRRSVSAQAIVVAMLLGGCGSAGTSQAPASRVPSRTSAHIAIRDSTFPTYKCRIAGQDPCSLADSTVKAIAASNFAGDGVQDAVLVVDSSDPGLDADCKTIDETGTFTFPTGTISFHSLHRDCNSWGSWAVSVPPFFGGPRIRTIFVVTGGTGEFSDATGYGTERDVDDEITYDGTIIYTTSATSAAG